MRFDIKGNPSYGEVDVELGPNETLLIEPGAMSRMSSNLNSSFQRQGGFFSAIFRKMFGGENFFLGKYEHPDGGKLTFAPSIPGHVEHRQLTNNSLNIMAGGFLACTPGVQAKKQPAIMFKLLLANCLCSTCPGIEGAKVNLPPSGCSYFPKKKLSPPNIFRNIAEKNPPCL